MSFKGQMVTVQQLIVFSMGIFILISVAYIYNNLNVNVKDATVEDQFNEVAEFTLNAVVYTYNSGKNKQLDVKTLLNIPKELSSQAYIIELNQSIIQVKSLENSRFNITIPVGNINESVDLNGRAISPKGKIKVNYNANSNIITLSDI